MEIGDKKVPKTTGIIRGRSVESKLDAILADAKPVIESGNSYDPNEKPIELSSGGYTDWGYSDSGN